MGNFNLIQLLVVVVIFLLPVLGQVIQALRARAEARRAEMDRQQARMEAIRTGRPVEREAAASPVPVQAAPQPAQGQSQSARARLEEMQRRQQERLEELKRRAQARQLEARQASGPVAMPAPSTPSAPARPGGPGTQIPRQTAPGRAPTAPAPVRIPQRPVPTSTTRAPQPRPVRAQPTRARPVQRAAPPANRESQAGQLAQRLSRSAPGDEIRDALGEAERRRFPGPREASGPTIGSDALRSQGLEEWRRAIVMREILSEPVGMRELPGPVGL
jgi:hypothetical protein